VVNGRSHRGRKAIDRLRKQFPNTTMVPTPVHASWFNQVEIYFSVAHRNVISPKAFTDLNVVVKRLADFETHYNQAAKPTSRRAADLHLRDTGWTARQITYQVADPHLTDDQFIQLRYQARMLDLAVGQALRAQANLDAATAIADDRAGGSPAIAPGSDHLAAT